MEGLGSGEALAGGSRRPEDSMGETTAFYCSATTRYLQAISCLAVAAIPKVGLAA
jgi:hypothetical protein